MQTRLESAIAAEVLDEIKRQRYTYKEIQQRADVKPRAFSYYFIAGERAIPFPVLASVCDVLELLPSELIARAERHAQSGEFGPERDDLEAGLSAHGRRVLREQREAHGVPADVADPSGRTRADVDDGRSSRSA